MLQYNIMRCNRICAIQIVSRAATVHDEQRHYSHVLGVLHCGYNLWGNFADSYIRWWIINDKMWRKWLSYSESGISNWGNGTENQRTVQVARLSRKSNLVPTECEPVVFYLSHYHCRCLFGLGCLMWLSAFEMYEANRRCYVTLEVYSRYAVLIIETDEEYARVIRNG
jgi:hypothetical protein